MRRAFTLMEMMVTVSIIAVIIAILVPTLLSSRAAAKEVVSIASVTSYCTSVDNELGSRWINGQLHCFLPRPSDFGTIESWTDPFRSTPISRDAVLAPLGLLSDGDFPPLGLGHFFVGFEDRESRPFSSPDDQVFAGLQLPQDAQFVVLGVGRNGRLDMNPQDDIVLVKTPMYESIIRHR